MKNNEDLDFQGLVNAGDGFDQVTIANIKHIGERIDLSDEQYNLLNPFYGYGKSVSSLLKIEAPAVFIMNSYRQLEEKLGNARDFKREVDNDTHKFQIICGKMKWLGYKWEDGKIVKDPDRLFQKNDPWVWDRDRQKLVKYDIETMRNKIPSGLLNDIKTYGLKTAWDNYRGRIDIVESYGGHMAREVRDNCVIFSPIAMLPFYESVDFEGDVFIDEGITGKIPTDMKLPSYPEIMEMVTGDVYSLDIEPNIPELEMEDYEEDFKELWEKTIELLEDMRNECNRIRNPDRTDFTENGRHYEFMVNDQSIIDIDLVGEVDDLLTELNSRGEFSGSPVTQEKSEQIDKGKIKNVKRINDLIRVANFLTTAAYSNQTFFYMDRSLSIKKIETKKRAIDYLYRMSLNSKGQFMILNASANLDYLNNELKNLAILGSPEYSPDSSGDISINNVDHKKSLETDFNHYSFGEGDSWNQANLSTDKFKKAIVPVIDWIAEDKDTMVISIKENRDGENVSELFDCDAMSFEEVEGSNVAKDKDINIVIGSQRRPDEAIWKELNSMYPNEVIQFDKEEWKEVKKIDERRSEDGRNITGSVVGFKDPERVLDDFEWEGEYDHNPLEVYWQQTIDRKVFEKMMRRRNQKFEYSICDRLGLNPTIGGEKVCQKKGDESDYLNRLIREKEGTVREKADWIKNNLKPMSFTEKSLPEDIPLKIVRDMDHGGNKWSYDWKGIIIDKLESRGWKPVGQPTGKRIELELFSEVEDITGTDPTNIVTKETMKNWIKDSSNLDYIPGSGSTSPKVKPSKLSENPYESHRI